MKRMSKSAPNPQHVWHAVFYQSPPEVLEQLLEAGMVPEPCLDEKGNDLLATFLGRADPESTSSEPRLAEFKARDGDLRGWRERATFQRVAIRLSERSDVDPFRGQGRHSLTGLQSAVISNLVPLVETLLLRPDAPSAQLLESQRPAASMPWVHKAAMDNNLALLQVLLEHGMDPKVHSAEQPAALFHAGTLPIAKALVDAGASLDVTWNNRNLVEHWAAQPAKTRPVDADLLPWLAQAMGPSVQGSDPVQVAAVTWLERLNDDASEWFWKFERGTAADSWQTGWDGHVTPYLASRPPLHEWSKTQSSGLLKGNVTMAAVIGAAWAQKALGDTSDQIPYLGLAQEPALFLGSKPQEIRKGVTDWGLFALGARLYEPDYAMKQSEKCQVFVERNHAALVSMMGERGTAEDWDGWMLDTLAGFQRLKNTSLRERISDAFEVVLKKQFNDAEKSWEHLSLQDQKPYRQQAKQDSFELAWKAAQRGVWFVPGASGQYLLNMVVGWGKPRNEGGLDPEACGAQWALLALVCVADTVSYKSSGVAPLPNETLFDLIDKHLLELKALPEIPAELSERVSRGLTEVAMRGSPGFSHWRALALEESLQANLPEAAPAPPRPRM